MPNAIYINEAQMKELTEQDIQKIMDYIDHNQNNSLRDRAIVNLSLKAGLRTTHIANLKVGDVLTDEGEIKDELRGGNQVVFLNQQVRDDIANYLEHRFNRPLVDISRLNQMFSNHLYPLHLFENRKRGYFDRHTLPAYIRSVYLRAGVKNTTGSSARATYIRKLASSGLSLDQMAKLSGLGVERIAQLVMNPTTHNERAVIDQM